MSIQLGLPVGKSVGDYTIISELGVGGFGITYLVEDNDGNNFVIKELFIRTEYACSRDNSGRVVVREEMTEMFNFARDRFIDEATVLQKLNHAAIVQVYKHFFENETAYYVMEYLHGESLESYVKRHKGLSRDDTIRYLFPVLEAVKEMHKLGLWHRDIKPANIMITEGRSVLIDFGTVKVTDAKDFSLRQGDSMFAAFSETFAAPEQLVDLNLNVDSRTDIYSLGGVLFYMLTAKPICRGARVRFNAGNGYIRNQLSKYNFDDVFKTVIEKSMQIEQKHRPQSVNDMQEILIADTIPLPKPPIGGLGGIKSVFWVNNWYFVVPIVVVAIIAFVLFVNNSVVGSALFTILLIGMSVALFIKNKSNKQMFKSGNITLIPQFNDLNPIVLKKNTYILGRDFKCDIVIPDKYSYASREHLSIHCDGFCLKIKELKVTQGTYINNKQLEPYKEYDWKEGEYLTIVDGSCQYRWEYI